MSIAAQLESAGRRAIWFGQSSGWAVLAAEGIAAVVFPIAEAIAIQSSLALVWLVGIALLHASVIAFALFGTHRMSDFLSRLDVTGMQEELKKIQSDSVLAERKLIATYAQMETHVWRETCITGSLSVLQGLLQTRHDSASPEDVAKLLAPLVAARLEALGFHGTDLHSFAVYCYDGTAGSLRLFYRTCDDRISRHDRSWEPGKGHVGIAFQSAKTIVTADISSESLWAQLSQEEAYETDTDYYRSFISTPIFGPRFEEGSPPIGVFVITSSRASHFGDDDKIVAESYSALLSIYFSSYDLPVS